MKNMSKIVESYHAFQEQEKDVFKHLMSVYSFLEKDIERIVRSFNRSKSYYGISGEEIFSLIEPKLTKEFNKLEQTKLAFEEKEGFKIDYNTFKGDICSDMTIPELVDYLIDYGRNVTFRNIKKTEWESSW